MNNIPAHQSPLNHFPKFSKGDEVEVIGGYSGVIHGSEKRSPDYNVFLYRVDLGSGIELFYENEISFA